MFKRQRQAGKGAGSSIGFKVEARVKDTPNLRAEAIELGNGQTLTGEWQEVNFQKSNNPAGVPFENGPFFPFFNTEDLLTYESAIALSWTLIAQRPFKQIQCRVVQYKVIYSFTREYTGFVKGSEIEHQSFLGLEIDDDAALPDSGPVESSVGSTTALK